MNDIKILSERSRRAILLELSKLLKSALVIGPALFLLIYVIIALARIHYPYELEWMEGGMVDHVRRILAWKPLYVEPSLSFIPFIYTPFYFYLSALLSQLLGIGFFPLRLLSFIASLGCFLILYRIVKIETNSTFCSFLATALFAATYRLGGAWLDIARVDSLFLFILLAAVYVFRSNNSNSGAIAAGILFFLAFMTKQTALIVVFPLCIYSLFLEKRWARVLFTGTILLTVVGGSFLFNQISDNWFQFYVFELPSQHPIIKQMVLSYWLHDLLQPLPIASMVSIFYGIQLFSGRKDRNFAFFAALAAGLIGASYLGRLHAGGYDNVLMPAYAAIAIFFGLGVNNILSLLPADSLPGDRALVSSAIESAVFFACILQFLLLAYNPLTQIPSKADRAAGDRLIQLIEPFDGEVFVPYHGYLPTLGGKQSYAHAMAISDVLSSKDKSVRAILTDDLREAFRDHYFAAIILDEPWMMEEIKPGYYYQETIFSSDDVFWPVTGMDVRPELIYLREE
jgi:4-amino-4-deoxy-L-arabinose transferase-like glycosyltransferase